MLSVALDAGPRAGGSRDPYDGRRFDSSDLRDYKRAQRLRRGGGLMLGPPYAGFAMAGTDAGMRALAEGRARSKEDLMSGSRLSSAALDERRRKILFRAWRRGMREMDLVMGQFADANLPGMSEGELDEFERLMDTPDADLLSWITGEAPPPEEVDTPLFARLRAAPTDALKRANEGT